MLCSTQLVGCWLNHSPFYQTAGREQRIQVQSAGDSLGKLEGMVSWIEILFFWQANTFKDFYHGTVVFTTVSVVACRCKHLIGG